MTGGGDDILDMGLSGDGTFNSHACTLGHSAHHRFHFFHCGIGISLVLLGDCSSGFAVVGMYEGEE